MEIAEQLKVLGFTLNEAKAYVALLQCQPATAYEIAKTAGLPTSKIYETVAKLTQRGVFHMQEDEAGTQQYVAMSPPDLMETIRSRTANQTRNLEQALQNLPGRSDANVIWPLDSLSQVQSHVVSMIEDAEESVLISLWPEELEWCERALRQAEDNGINIALVHFGKPQINIGATYHHPVEKTLYAEKGGRGLTVVVDGSRVVIANFQADDKVDGAWSRNPTFVTVAEDYVKHDVYITKVTRFLGPEVVQRFGEDYARLRDVFNADA